MQQFNKLQPAHETLNILFINTGAFFFKVILISWGSELSFSRQYKILLAYLCSLFFFLIQICCNFQY